MGKTATPPKGEQRRRWLPKVLLLLLSPLVALLLLEGGLRLFGAGFDTRFLIPEAGGESGKLRDNDRFSWRFFPPALARLPQPIRVEARKPAETVRVVVLGGSAAMGDPQPAFGLPRMLASQLHQRHPGRRFEVINAAVTAVNSHVVLPIAEDCLVADADVWVIYMGNNEVNGPFGSGSVFGSSRPPRSLIRANLRLQEARLGQVMAAALRGREKGTPEHWGGMEMFLRHKVTASDPDLKRVYENFSGNVEALLALGRRSEIPVVLSTVAVNLRDSPPFVSETAVPEEERLVALVESGDWAGAEKFCRDALATAGEKSATLWYALGISLIEGNSGSREEARRALQRACDLDTLRFRADSEINRRLRELGGVQTGGVPLVLVDAEERMGQEAADGVPGREFFYEHVHFTFRGNFHLSRWIAEGVEEVLGLEGTAEWPTEEDCARWLGYTAFHRREILQEMRLRLQTAPFAGRMGEAKRLSGLDRALAESERDMAAETPAAAVEAYRRLLMERPDDWVLHQQLAILLASLDRLKEAEKEWEAVVSAVPHDSVSWYQLGAARNRLKEWPRAEVALREALARRERHPRAWNSLGICLAQQGRFSEAYPCFEKAVFWAPDFAEAFMNWGMVLQNQGESGEAEERLRDAVRADSSHVPSRLELARFLTKNEAFAQAEEAYQALVDLLPEDVGARLNLALVRMKLGRREEAVEAFRAVLERDPGNELAKRYLRQLEGGKAVGGDQ